MAWRGRGAGTRQGEDGMALRTSRYPGWRPGVHQQSLRRFWVSAGVGHELAGLGEQLRMILLAGLALGCDALAIVD